MLEYHRNIIFMLIFPGNCFPPVSQLEWRCFLPGQTWFCPWAPGAAEPTSPCSPRRPSPSGTSSPLWNVRCKPEESQ